MLDKGNVIDLSASIQGGRSIPTSICVHCKKVRRIVAKGICSSCYNAPAIHAKYKRRSPGRKKHTGDMNRFAARGVGVKGKSLPPSTVALPGSEAKIVALEARALLCQQLWNDDDAFFDLG